MLTRPTVPKAPTATPDEYIRSVLTRYELAAGPGSPAETAAENLSKPIKEWAGRYLIDVQLCGSYVKGTRVKGSTDLDLLVLLGPRTPLGVDRLYDYLFSCMKRKDFGPRRQNVSVGLTFQGLAVDLIPARQEQGSSGDVLVFETERRRSVRTNLDTHLRVVRQSNWSGEIRALKVWRNLRGLRFPSFCLELTVIDALRNREHGRLARNIETVLQYLRDAFVGAPIRDPANFDNRVSDDLVKHEKIAISEAAARTLVLTDWGRVIW